MEFIFNVVIGTVQQGSHDRSKLPIFFLNLTNSF